MAYLLALLALIVGTINVNSILAVLEKAACTIVYKNTSWGSGSISHGVISINDPITTLPEFSSPRPSAIIKHCLKNDPKAYRKAIFQCPLLIKINDTGLSLSRIVKELKVGLANCLAVMSTHVSRSQIATMPIFEVEACILTPEFPFAF